MLVFVYALAFVVPIFTEQFKDLEVSRSVLITQIVLDGVTTFIQTFCLLLGFKLARWLWVVLWPILCLFTAINNFTFNTFHTQVSKYAIGAVMDPKAREAESLFTPDFCVMLGSGIALAVLGIVLMKRERYDRRNWKASLVALLLAVGLITINSGSMATPYPPYNFLTATYQYAYDRFIFTPESRKDISKEGGSFSSKGKTPLITVVVIGESARSDHFSINGYERETTPLLQARKNLVNFKNTIACGVWTHVSVPCLMTRASIADTSVMYRETSFISVFRMLGFHTAWLSTQGKHSFYYPVTTISLEADEHVMLEEAQVLDNTIKDDQLLPLLDKELENTDQPQLIVLHTYGSHWQYSARYTKDYERYTPVCATTLSRSYDSNSQVKEIQNCYTDHEAIVNSYDNSILYTDHILDEVIKRLENKNALFVYTSDHGESLGEHGRFLHGHENAMENRNVPMFWWASDDYIATNPERWQNLIKKSAEPATHDVIFHSVLDCSGVSSPVIDPAQSLCRDAIPVPANATEPAAATEGTEATQATEPAAITVPASPAATEPASAAPAIVDDKSDNPEADQNAKPASVEISKPKIKPATTNDQEE